MIHDIKKEYYKLIEKRTMLSQFNLISDSMVQYKKFLLDLNKIDRDNKPITIDYSDYYLIKDVIPLVLLELQKLYEVKYNRNPIINLMSSAVIHEPIESKLLDISFNLARERYISDYNRYQCYILGLIRFGERAPELSCVTLRVLSDQDKSLLLTYEIQNI